MDRRAEVRSTVSGDFAVDFDSASIQPRNIKKEEEFFVSFIVKRSERKRRLSTCPLFRIYSSHDRKRNVLSARTDVYDDCHDSEESFI